MGGGGRRSRPGQHAREGPWTRTRSSFLTSKRSVCWSPLALAAIGLIVAITGVYGVTAFMVGQRRHEIGVRLALGATAPGVIRLIMGRSFRLVGAGVVVGLLGGWAIGLTMRSLLFGVGATDPLTYAVVLTVVAAGGLLATYLPAHRVVSIDPAIVLKRE